MPDKRETTRLGLAWRVGLAVAVFGGVAWSCKLMSETAAPDKAAQQRDAAADSEQAEASEQEQLLPVLNAEALQARVQAQRAALGSAELFEDAQGNPVPWLSPQNAIPIAQDEPSIDDDLLASLPGSSGLGGGKPMRSRGINGNALGLFEPVETGDGGDEPLERFHDALRKLRAGRDPDGKVRVLVYGGSHTDADIYPHYMRTYLQQRFGDGGHGFVQVAKPWRWYGHVDVAVEGLRDWKTEHAQRRSGRDDGYFGLLGASLSTRSSKAFGRVTIRGETTASNIEVYYLAQPGGGRFRVVTGGQAIATVDTEAPSPRAGYYAFDLPEGQHEIEIHPVGDGEIRMFGMTLESDRPGVVVDTLGIGGTRAANMLQWDEAVWSDNVRRRAPDLFTLFYGTNEATDVGQPIEAYEADLRASLDRLQRAAPDASCLIIGPGDFPMQTDDGGWVPRPRVSEIIEVQARVAHEMGCGFWDTQAFMGGELSMVQWVHANPPMAKDDHIHFTRRGYVRLGMAVTDAIMLPFDGANGLSAGSALASP